MKVFQAIVAAKKFDIRSDRKFSGLPLRLILVLPFVVQIFGSVGLIGYLSFKNGHQAVKEVTERLMNKNNNLVAEHLNNYLATPQKVNQINLRAIELGLLDLKDFPTAGHYFWQQLQTYPNMTYISYALPTGEYAGAGRFLADRGVTIDELSAATDWKSYTYATDERGNRTEVAVIYDDYQPLQEAAYLETVKAGKTIWTKPYNWDGETSAGYISIGVSTPIYDRENRLIGVIGIDLLLDSINTFLQQLQISPTAKIFIIERDGLLIGSSSKEKPFNIVNGVAKRIKAIDSSDEQIRDTTAYLLQKFGNFSAIQDKQKLHVELKGEHQLVGVTPWKDELGLDWLVITTIPESDFMTQINANTQTTIILCALALLVSIGLGWITSYWIAKPILLLGEASVAIAQGDLDRQIKVKSIVELEVLSDSFNQMAQQLKASFTKLAQINQQLDRTNEALAKNNLELETRVEQRTVELQKAIARLEEEIVQHQATQAKLLHQSLHDALTGLPNRTLFMEHLQKALQRTQRNRDYLFAVLFIDLDRFKTINDTWGHLVGDRFLKLVASILQECCRQVDTVARLSGDEFTILLEDLPNEEEAVAIAKRLLKRLTAPIELEEHKLFSGASIGIVFGSTRRFEVEELDSATASSNYQHGMELLRDADIAMYRAKASGKGCYAIFDRQMYDLTLQISQMERDLRLAIERREFILNYQPIISLKTFKLIGFEVLLRWQHPVKGLIFPGDFITLAEETGLIVLIGEWVLKEACEQLRTWQNKFTAASSLYVSVNLSGKQIQQLDFVAKLAKILEDTELDGKNLHLELTETMLMDRGEKTIQLLSQIKEQRVQLSIDDFGTGYSSLSYLHYFPIDTLKIDRSFVSSIGIREKNCEIVRTIITLAHALGIQAIAEGVETPPQVTHLRNLGCKAAQGYLFAKPLDLTAAELAIANNLKWY